MTPQVLVGYCAVCTGCVVEEAGRWWCYCLRRGRLRWWARWTRYKTMAEVTVTRLPDD